MRLVRVARLAQTALEAVGISRMARDNSAAARARRLHFACTDIAATHGLQLAMRGQLPLGPAILVANHVSYLDVIAISAVTPCAPIAKCQVGRWPVIGSAAVGLGAILVDRDDPWSRVVALRRAYATLRAGVSILNFPEGTTTDGNRMLPFKRGIFGLAALANVPVIPIAVKCAEELAWYGDASFLPHYLRTTQLDPKIELVIGPPLLPSQFASADELALVAHHRIARMLRDSEESHAANLRSRVSASRSNTVLSPADRRSA